MIFLKRLRLLKAKLEFFVRRGSHIAVLDSRCS